VWFLSLPTLFSVSKDCLERLICDLGEVWVIFAGNSIGFHPSVKLTFFEENFSASPTLAPQFESGNFVSGFQGSAGQRQILCGFYLRHIAVLVEVPQNLVDINQSLRSSLHPFGCDF